MHVGLRLALAPSGRENEEKWIKVKEETRIFNELYSYYNIPYIKGTKSLAYLAVNAASYSP